MGGHIGSNERKTPGHRRKRPPILGPMELIIGGAVFLVLGLAGAIWGYSTLARDNASASWPSVEGTMLSSTVSRRVSRTGSGAQKSTRIRHEVNVSYEYTVNGQFYTSDRIRREKYQTRHPSRAWDMARKYPQGKKVDVYYDPASPDKAVLIAGAHEGSYIFLCAGIFFLLVGGAVLAFGLRKRSARTARATLSS